MPLIWAAISAHGFGHAAQVVPVLNALGRLVSDLRVLLRTTVPASFFKDRLVIPWEVSAVQQDVGCIQNGPLTIDVEATWREHKRFHATWTDRVQTEIEAIRAVRPDVILADTPYLAVEAGAKASIPTVALVSFTWDLILSEYLAPPHTDSQALIQSIRQAYALADLALRITPAPKMEIFKRIIDIGPIAAPASSSREQLTKLLALNPNERTILVGFGGIPLASLPFAALEQLAGYRFLFDGPTPPDSKRFVSTKSLPFSFKTLLASVDVIMTKPGYGTLVEAVALQTPLVYVRRYNFADEQPLVDYLHRHGRGIELSLDDFVHGKWEPALRQILTQPLPKTPPPPTTGAIQAATFLVPYLKRNGT
jgi:predicted glycosyltransferase